jgi:hypothetical protein
MIERARARIALLRALLLSPAFVLAMWRSAPRLAVPGAVEDDIAGVVRQPGATPAFWQLRRHKPIPRSSPSLWGSPQAVSPILLFVRRTDADLYPAAEEIIRG